MHTTKRLSFLILLAALLGSCAVSEDVVQDGPFQKRKYFKKGWHYDKPVKSGMEEFAVEEISLEGSGPEADPYLKAIGTDLLKIEDHDDIGSLHLDLQAAPHADRNIALDDLQKKNVTVDRLRSDAIIPAIMTFPEPEYASFDPFMTTGFAFLLPVALLIALVVSIRRIGGSNNNGARAELLALVMGMAGLAALAVI